MEDVLYAIKTNRLESLDDYIPPISTENNINLKN
jgi:hypothetical protein